MARPEDIPTDLTLDIGNDLAPGDFLAVVRNFINYVTEITDAQKGDGAVVDWTVKVKEGSNLIALQAGQGASPSRLAMIYNQVDFGIRTIAEGNVSGSGLPEGAINNLRRLSDLAGKQQQGQHLNIWVRRKPIPISPAISKAVQEDVEADYYDIGTVEGRLDTIQDASGAIKIQVKDYLYTKPIACLVQDDLLEKVLSSFRKRVEIEGKIHYRRNGIPISIEAAQLTILPEDDELPSADDVRGIMAEA
jgi:hypothetical protein